MSVIKCEVLKNNENLRSVKLDINLNNWKEYRNTLQSFKTDMNAYLTELVEQETDIDFNHETDEEESESSGEENNGNGKRNSGSPIVFVKQKMQRH